jgi:hypothetical protein
MCGISEVCALVAVLVHLQAKALGVPLGNLLRDELGRLLGDTFVEDWAKGTRDDYWKLESWCGSQCNGLTHGVIEINISFMSFTIFDGLQLFNELLFKCSTLGKNAMEGRGIFSTLYACISAYDCIHHGR